MTPPPGCFHTSPVHSTGTLSLAVAECALIRCHCPSSSHHTMMAHGRLLSTNATLRCYFTLAVCIKANAWHLSTRSFHSSWAKTQGARSQTLDHRCTLRDLLESVENRLLFLERCEAARVQIDGSSPLLRLSPLMRQIAVTIAARPGPLAQKTAGHFGYFGQRLL